MPVPSPNFVALFPLQETIFSKDDGELLSGGVVTFYRDSSREVLKPVYQQVQLPDNTYDFVLLNNPITLSAIGSFQDNDGNDIIPYLYPYTGSPTDTNRGALDLYYITVQSSGLVLQFTREAWPPGVGSQTNPQDIFEGTSNILSNPQFALISFVPDPTTSSFTFNVTGANTFTPIAPNWDIVTSGTGTFTVQQVALTVTNVASDPSYALDISSTDITDIYLRQRLVKSPRILYNQFISGYLEVATVGTGSTQVTMSYVPSSGSSYQILSDVSSGDGNFTPLIGTVAATGTANSDSPDTGYVDINIVFPALSHVRITSAQVVNVQNIDSFTPYLQESVGRQIDHTYHNSYPIVPIGSVIDYAGLGVPAHYLLCDGGLYSRVTYALLFNALTVKQSVQLNTNSSIVVSNPQIYYIGMHIEGTGIQANTTITNIVGTTLTLSLPSTITAVSIITLFLWGGGDGSTTFNVPGLQNCVTAGAFGSLFASNTVGVKGGNSTHLITTNELAPHTHDPLSPNTGFIEVNAASAVGLNSSVGIKGTTAATTGPITGAGAQTSLSLVQPTALVNKLIRYE